VTVIRIDGHEHLPLDTGWGAVATSPGATDRRLEGLDDLLLPATVPGTAAATLLANGQRIAGRDLDDEDWWFRCRFEAPQTDPDTETVLRLDGLATLAEVWLNGEHVLSSDNMFVRHELPVGPLLQRSNELVVGFRALARDLATKRPRPRWRTRLVAHQNLRFVRTTLLGRIAAFAPEPAPVGPWAPISLERRRRITVDDVFLRAGLDGKDGVLRVRLRLRSLGGFVPEQASLSLDGPSGAHRCELNLVDGVAEGALRVPDVAPWWPHTHGDPTLHEARIELRGAEEVVGVDCGRVGFRTVEATHEPGLELQVNGESVFCRGGALMPDLVTVQFAGDRLRSILTAAREAGMNMIRLSGVTSYASDELLTRCDELGLLLWQDFPFASLDYPIEDATFRASVEHETHAFLTRAGSHACLAVLCGNSEVEQQVGMLGLDPALGRGELFGELLPTMARAAEVDATYVPSSPTGGDEPFRPNRGVAHYFGVGAYLRPLDDARRADVRFASECLAFANVPDDEAISRLAPGGSALLAPHHPVWKAGVPRDTGAGWDFDDVRDHYLEVLYRVDPVELRSYDLEHYLALSRLVTGEVMAAAFGEWRRAGSTCAGALLWWLNDLVPGAGWGVLDEIGRPKPAYWYLKRALAPIAVWMTDEGTNGIAVHVANDTATTLEATLQVALYRSDGVGCGEAEIEIALPARATRELAFESVLGHFADAGYAFRFGPPGHDVAVASLLLDGELRSQAFHYPHGHPSAVAPPGSLGLEASVERTGEGGLVLRVRSDRLAHGVKVHADGFAPDDDAFTLAPGNERLIRLTPSEPGEAWRGGSVVAANAAAAVPLTQAPAH
jgi:beta-mannosidase